MTPQSLDALLSGLEAASRCRRRDVAVGIPADLVRRRPDIRAAELAAAAQSAQIGIAEADLYPGVQPDRLVRRVLPARCRTPRSATSSPRKGITFAFGPSFSWNILNYGQITNNVRVQDAKLQALLVDYQNTVLKAQKEVEDGLAHFLQSRRAGRLSAPERRRRAMPRSHRARSNTISAPAISPPC